MRNITKGVGIHLFSLTVILWLLGTETARGQAAHVRWDIISLSPPVSPGGVAFAAADDGATIKLTGTGTFVAPATGGGSSSVTGGGDWETFDSAGNSTGNGTYNVTSLVRWDKAPGALPPTVPDLIGDPAERSAGLAVLRIRYSDSRGGILVISCRLPGSPPSMPEGVSASKGFVDYYDIQRPVSGVDANRTLFHVQ